VALLDRIDRKDDDPDKIIDRTPVLNAYNAGKLNGADYQLIIGQLADQGGHLPPSKTALNDLIDGEESDRSVLPVADVRRFPVLPPILPPESIPGSPAFRDNTIRSIRKFIDTYFPKKYNADDRFPNESAPDDDEDADSDVNDRSATERKSTGRSKRKRADYTYCHERFADEERQCYANRWQMAHPDYLRGCLQRAADRRSDCIANGGTPSKDEPKKWIHGPDHDEETWRNLKR
jgi:hypothetical protein